MIYKITGKSLKKNRKLLIAMAIMYVLANFLIIFSTTIDYHYKNDFNNYMEKANVEDFLLQVDPIIDMQLQQLGLDPIITSERIEQISSEYNVILEEVNNGVFRFEQNDLSANIELTMLNENNVINQLTVVEGRLPNAKNEIFFNDKYLEANNLKVGDKILIFDQEMTIVGYGLIPTYIYPISFQAIYPNPERFGSAYITQESFDYLVNTNQMFPTISLSGQFKDELSRNDRFSLVREIVDNQSVSFETYNSNFEKIEQTSNIFISGNIREFNMRISSFENEITNNAAFLSTMGITIALISVFLTVLLFNSILKSQRREMGILKAEGVQTIKIAVSFIIHFILILIPSILVGGLVAKLVMPLLQGMYEQYYSLPITDVGLHEMIVALPDVLVIFVSVVVFVFFFSIYNNLRTPTLLLIKNVDKSQTPKLNITKLFHKAPFILKYRLNILVRNWTKTLFLTFAVMISSFLLLLAALGLSGIKEIFNVFETMYHYDFEAYHSHVLHTEQDQDRSNLAFILQANIDSVELESEQRTNFENEKIQADIDNNDTPSINLFGFYPEQNELITLVDKNRNQIPYTDFSDGIVVTQLISEFYSVQIGDSINVSFTNSQNETVTKTLQVTNIVDNFIYPFAYTHMSNVQNLTGAEENSFNVTLGMMEDRNHVYEIDPNVMFVSTKEMLTQLEQQTDFIYMTMGIVAVVAAIISLVTLTSISSVIVNANRKTISIMKVMGYHNHEIKKMTIATYKWICIFVYFATIPFILWLINTLIGLALSNQDFTLPLRLNLEFLILGFIIIFGVYLISSSLVFRSIKKINMSESLKSDE